MTCFSTIETSPATTASPSSTTIIISPVATTTPAILTIRIEATATRTTSAVIPAVTTIVIASNTATTTTVASAITRIRVPSTTTTIPSAITTTKVSSTAATAVTIPIPLIAAIISIVAISSQMTKSAAIVASSPTATTAPSATVTIVTTTAPTAIPVRPSQWDNINSPSAPVFAHFNLEFDLLILVQGPIPIRSDGGLMNEEILASVIWGYETVALCPIELGSYGSGQEDEVRIGEAPWRIHTLFSTECQNYFDWQTVGIMHSFKKAGHPGPITRLLSCTEEEKKEYKGMNLAPTMEVPSMSRHPKTGDWYPAINKPAAVHHWLQHSQEAQNVDWVVILDADMIVRGPIIPWKLGVEKGRPVAAHYGYLIGCDNVLAKLHTSHPELCDKVGGLLAFHIDDLKALAPLWLSKTEEVRGDRAHWATNITGDIYGKGWISEMYGYSFGAAEVGLRHKITNDLMIYPGYTPREGVEPILFHYGLPFKVGNWSFSKLEYHEDRVVYDCGRLFPEPPYPREVNDLEPNPQKRSALMLSIECINTLNEGLHLQHSAMGCPKPKWSRYLSFLKSRTFAKLTRPRYVSHVSFLNEVTQAESEDDKDEAEKPLPKIHTLFSTECTPYFDWQTVGFMHSFKLSGQPGNITRLLSCTDEDLKRYKGHNLAPTHYVPSYSKHPLTGDWYPAINKPVAVLHWLNHAEIDAEFIIILDADMIIRGPITPWEFNVARRRPVSAPYDYLIGCHNILAQLHTRNPDACDKVGGVIIMHIDDLRKFAMLWLHKTEEVRADTDHYATNITGDVYNSGWISEMYGYSFGAAELKLRHLINKNIMLYPGYVPEPGVDYRVFHYGLEFKVGTWSFDKAKWRNVDLVNNCWAKFPEPPDPSTLVMTDENARARDLLSIECGKTLNEALYLHHKRRKCPDPNSITSPKLESRNDQTTKTSRKFNRIFRRDAKKKNDHIVEGKDSEEDLSTNPDSPDQLFSSFRIWIVLLWVVSFVGFLALMIAIYSRGGSRRKEKGKHHHKGKRRHSYLGLFDSNGIDRHLRTSDIDAKL